MPDGAWRRGFFLSWRQASRAGKCAANVSPCAALHAGRRGVVRVQAVRRRRTACLGAQDGLFRTLKLAVLQCAGCQAVGRGGRCRRRWGGNTGAGHAAARAHGLWPFCLHPCVRGPLTMGWRRRPAARHSQGRKVLRRPAQASFPVRRRQVCRPRQISWACSLPFTIILLFLHIPSGKIHCP